MMNLLFFLSQCFTVFVTCTRQSKNKYIQLKNLDEFLEGKLDADTLFTLKDLYSDLMREEDQPAKEWIDFPLTINSVLMQVRDSGMSHFQKKVCYNILWDSIRLKIHDPSLNLPEAEKQRLYDAHFNIQQCNLRTYPHDHERRMQEFKKASKALRDMHFSAKFPEHSGEQPAYYDAVHALKLLERGHYTEDNKELTSVLAVERLMSYYETVKQDKDALKEIEQLALIMEEICIVPLLVNSDQRKSLLKIVEDIELKTQQ